MRVTPHAHAAQNEHRDRDGDEYEQNAHASAGSRAVRNDQIRVRLRQSGQKDQRSGGEDAQKHATGDLPRLRALVAQKVVGLGKRHAALAGRVVLAGELHVLHIILQQIIRGDPEDARKLEDLAYVRDARRALPLGDRLARHARLLRQFLLRPAVSAPQRQHLFRKDHIHTSFLLPAAPACGYRIAKRAVAGQQARLTIARAAVANGVFSRRIGELPYHHTCAGGANQYEPCYLCCKPCAPGKNGL